MKNSIACKFELITQKKISLTLASLKCRLCILYFQQLDSQAVTYLPFLKHGDTNKSSQIWAGFIIITLTQLQCCLRRKDLEMAEIVSSTTKYTNAVRIIAPLRRRRKSLTF